MSRKTRQNHPAMILTPLSPEQFAASVAAYGRHLPSGGMAAAVFRRIVKSRDIKGRTDYWHWQAVSLTERFHMQPLSETPQRAFSWDGIHVRTLSEPAVLIHEVAHYQLASPARRFLPDFGLGAGPETGNVFEADQARRLEDDCREVEEQMASLLGILWEIALGQPGINAFIEQNWLEGAERPGTAAFLDLTLSRLHRLNLIDDAGHPLEAVRICADPFSSCDRGA